MSELSVSRQQQGLADHFTVVAPLKQDFNDKTSSEYSIDNLVTICFTVREKDRRRADFIIKVKKNKEVCSAVNINVNCTKQRFSEQWFCTDAWSEKYVGRDIEWQERILTKHSDGYLVLLMFRFEINVNASKMIIMGPSLYEDENFTDFRLSTADGSVGVHKASLAAHSDMFKNMLNGEWKETVEGRIEVEGASLQTLQALKEFMYLGKLPEEGLQTLLQIAIRFFIESLKKECIIKLAQNVTPEEYLELLDFARDKEIVELTFALLQLTPKEVVNSAYQMMIKSKQLPEAGDKTDKE